MHARRGASAELSDSDIILIGRGLYRHVMDRVSIPPYVAVNQVQLTHVLENVQGCGVKQGGHQLSEQMETSCSGLVLSTLLVAVLST